MNAQQYERSHIRKTHIMKGIKFIIISCWLISANFTIAQTQKLVTIEMYRHNDFWVASSGYGVETYATVPFIVKTTDDQGFVTQNIYQAENRRSPLETLPYLRKEIDLWLSRGYKLFSFNITPTGETSTAFRYLVLLVKDE
jgi:hypothetical protein